MNRPKVPISVASWREIPGNFTEILVKSYNLAGSMNGGAHCSLLRRQRLAYNLPIIYKKRLDIKNLWWMQRNSSSKASFLGCSRFRNVSLWRKGFYLGTKQPIGSIREVSTQMYAFKSQVHERHLERLLNLGCSNWAYTLWKLKIGSLRRWFSIIGTSFSVAPCFNFLAVCFLKLDGNFLGTGKSSSG